MSSDYTPRGMNRREIDEYIALARETEGVTEAGLWRSAFANVGGAIAYAIADVADAIRDAAEGGYTRVEE